MKKLIGLILSFLLVATLAVAEDKGKVKNSPSSRKSTGVIQEPLKEQEPDRPRSKLSIPRFTVKYGDDEKALTGQRGRVIHITISGAKEPLKIFLIEPGAKPGEKRQIGLLRPKEKVNRGWRFENGSWKKVQPIKPVLGAYAVKVTDEQGRWAAQKTAD